MSFHGDATLYWDGGLGEVAIMHPSEGYGWHLDL